MNPSFHNYAPRGTRLLLASSFLATVPLGYLLVVLPLYLARAGIEPAVIGGFYTASGAMTALLVAFSGVLADRWGRRRFLIAGTLLPIASYIIFALSTGAICLALIVIAPVFVLAALLVLVRGFMTNLSWPFQQSLLMIATAPEERATAVGLGFSVWRPRTRWAPWPRECSSARVRTPCRCSSDRSGMCAAD